MTKSHGAVVAQVKKGSLAWQAGVRKGDHLLAINGVRPRDYIDYRYRIARESLNLKLRRPKGGNLLVHLEKEPDEDLGIRFSTDVFDKVRTCRCRCKFCFVSQLPPGLRPSLYLRDDDYRLSFLHGNFITLSNLTEADFHRILKFNLSPLWISVHATDPEMRGNLMGSTTLPDILSQMKRLTEGGIELHTQVVICPGLNDGPVLEKTVEDLSNLHPAVKSIGIVPVGINLPEKMKGDLQPVAKGIAVQIIQQVQHWQRGFLESFGTSLVWASDEMYLIAGMEFPPTKDYENFCQRENGIGEARLFLEEVKSAEFEKRLKEKVALLGGKPLRLLLGTGGAASGLVTEMASRLNCMGLQTSVAVAVNRLLGPAITSASLVAGDDWLEALSKASETDLVILPKQSLNSNGRFLDDVSRREFAQRLGIPVGFARTPLEAADLIVKYSKDILAGPPIEPLAAETG
ncbi:MAG: DUF512 domain-containing protein [Armatimonadetes bacterium]|nr:DUF512 domain-containing protein [Armatimonadota bacterium]NIM23119.1 DUF512 domain-containing protein [Armatimonadota bacterium]NIM66987.1 DUF512 domain-containing protein [Armatimonadota bacterium]NIM75521.1 DUF512 domain-containing protein [Armatimonadota bacterium]NIN05176.1 DUF512 domain-containing protein [Armatimonadota bacterium]